jgi:hypothetical protein
VDTTILESKSDNRRKKMGKVHIEIAGRCGE